jgi:YggT family protein
MFDFWYFHLPNYALAALMYTILGRLILSIIFPPESDNYIWRAFCRLTDPIIDLVGLITPKAVPRPIVMMFTFVWLIVLRFALFAALSGAGLAPPAVS